MRVLEVDSRRSGESLVVWEAELVANSSAKLEERGVLWSLRPDEDVGGRGSPKGPGDPLLITNRLVGGDGWSLEGEAWNRGIGDCAPSQGEQRCLGGFCYDK